MKNSLKPPLPTNGRSPTTINFSSKQLSLTEKRSFFSKLNAASCTNVQSGGGTGSGAGSEKKRGKRGEIEYFEGLSRKEAVKAMIN